ncbi:hypothetical protein TRIUR3_10600 [Triticum urartu]|uniref:CASP-like protein n=1 Tax=Triticum urartu TaxID=4572 RepID=M7ZDP0_TRIUA|nr:hypothetical protein TRIUR3_10600 [Triticum urartu]
MASTDDFNEVTAFRLLVTAEALQCLWSLALAAVDVYALLVKRAFRTPRATTIYSIGDWVTGALTFAAASGSAGITVLINDDLMMCSENHCPSFMASTSMAFFTWFAIAPSCLFNLMTAIYGDDDWHEEDFWAVLGLHMIYVLIKQAVGVPLRFIYFNLKDDPSFGGVDAALAAYQARTRGATSFAGVNRFFSPSAE